MFVGRDCGTQGTKVVIYESITGRLIIKGQVSHPLIQTEDTREQGPNGRLIR